MLPSTFNASQYLTIGNYQAVFTYVPSVNFTQPQPLTVTFQVTVRSSRLCICNACARGHRSPPLGLSLVTLAGGDNLHASDREQILLSNEVRDVP